MGLNALNLTAMVAAAEVEPILRALLDARASIGEQHFWGGKSSLLCLLALNEGANLTGAARLLLEQGCDVNARFRAQTRTWKMMLQGMRLAARVDDGTATREFAVLEGSTPLHFAAKRGDVDLVKVLVEHRADLDVRNKQGRTPLDVACLYFGGSPPSVLRDALSQKEVAVPSQMGALPALLGAKNEQKTVKGHPADDHEQKDIKGQFADDHWVGFEGGARMVHTRTNTSV